MTASSAAIVWFRQDLRLEDNDAFLEAVKSGLSILPLYIHDEDKQNSWERGAASKLWLHYALKSLETQLKAKRMKLIIRSGSSKDELLKLIFDTGAKSVYINCCYEPYILNRDREIYTDLKEKNIDLNVSHSSLLFRPGSIKNKSGNPYKVFTAFWKHCRTLKLPARISSLPDEIHSLKKNPTTLKIEELKLLPERSWGEGIFNEWAPDNSEVKKILKDFIKSGISKYTTDRDIPSVSGTSKISPYLHFGQIGPRQIWTAIRKKVMAGEDGAVKFFAEIGWREFSYHLLYNFPHSIDKALNSEFDSFPWKKNKKIIRKWQRGLTGYPIVDAGMRQLWQTGYIHNRVRMIVASVFVKQFQQPWQEGAKWFWDTLVDADLASNTQGWQWSAGSGADAAPYFRVFNPVLQGQRFDKEGTYVKKWLPELSKLPAKYIHEPWKAPDTILEEAGIQLGKDYPEPIISPMAGRIQALQAYERFKQDIKK